MKNKKILVGIFTLLFLISCCVDKKKENFQEVEITETTEVTIIALTQETTTVTTITTTKKLTTTRILTTTTYTKIPSVINLSFSTDKELYHSNEIMKIKVFVNSEDEIKDTLVKVYGIMSGYYRLNIEERRNLNKGLNEINFEYRTPSCTGCAGIRQGNYEITAELIYNDKTIKKETKNIEIRQ